MKKNNVLILLISLAFSLVFNETYSVNEETQRNYKKIAKQVCIAGAAGILAGEMYAHIGENLHNDLSSSNLYTAGRILIDLPLINLINNTDETRTQTLINNIYLITSTLSYYISPYVHDVAYNLLNSK